MHAGIAFSRFIVWVLATAWWAAITYAPALLIGGARTYVKFAPVWSTYYWPVLFLMLAGVAQRAANYVRPDWNWLPPVMRLVSASSAWRCSTRWP